MMRYLDKRILLAGAVVLFVVAVLQISGIVGWKSKVREKTAAASRLKAQADETDLPDLVRNPLDYSRRVFSAWEKLPLAEPLDAWDFYPNP